MIQEFIVDEQEHYNWVRRHLHQIEAIGLNDYLTDMMG